MLSTLAQKLKYARHQKGLTQSELADKLGLSRTSVVNFETDYKRPTPDQIKQISDILHVDRLWILKDDDFYYGENDRSSEERSPTELSKKLTLLRKSKGLILDDIAKVLNKSRAAYAKYERGQAEPNIETLILISKFYNVSIDDLLGVSVSEKNELSPFEDTIEEWIVELIKARDNKKIAMKNIWEEIKKL